MISIPWERLCLMLLPIGVVSFIYLRWSMNVRHVLYATCRMVVQLLLVGYALIFIFGHESAWLSSGVILSMMLCASWIALRPIKQQRRSHYRRAFLAIGLGSIVNLALVILCVLQLDPWYSARYMIPIAGMIISNSMNSVSLCAERFHAEYERASSYETARNIAFQTGLLPLLNSFFAVGLVAIPGMMTGQIIAGNSPLLAVHYQIMVMCMVLGGGGVASAIYLILIRDTLRTG